MTRAVRIEQASFGPDYQFPRLLRGGWQLAGGHGEVDHEKAVADMFAFVDAGVTAFDCADIYTGVEELIGQFRLRLARERGAEALRSFKVHTKFVPDWDQLGSVTRGYVETIIDRSLKRLNAERLDLVQYAWWNYAAPGMIDTALILQDLVKAGKIDRLGGTNFGAAESRAIFAAGVPLVAMQTQYSLLDARPEHGLTTLCAETGMQLLCYGTVAGGFLSERWLGQPEPQGSFANRSLIKYKLIIDEFGGWDLFQRLLGVLAGIAEKHGVGLTAVATRHVLDLPHVAGVIVGARYADHLDANLAVFRFALDATDKAAIAAVLAERKGPLGEPFALERDREGPHGRIMRYNLNKD